MDHSSPPLRATALLAEGARLVVRPPYITLLAVGLFVSFVSGRVTFEDASGLVASLFLWVVLAYLQIAVILAAAAGAPRDMPASLVPQGGHPGSADPWLRGAFRRRSFLRYFIADAFSLLLVAVALVAFVLPGLVVGGIVTLAPMAAVLEYRGPAGAVRRSIELSRPARVPIGVVFAICVLVPNVALQLLYLVRDGNVDDAAGIALRLVTVLLGMIATIALTKAFLVLGGTTVPLSARRAWTDGAP